MKGNCLHAAQGNKTASCCTPLQEKSQLNTSFSSKACLMVASYNVRFSAANKDIKNVTQEHDDENWHTINAVCSSRGVTREDFHSSSVNGRHVLLAALHHRHPHHSPDPTALGSLGFVRAGV